MAFTDAQRVQIRYFMGYPQLYLQTYSILEMALNAIEQKAEMSALVLELVASLQNIDAELLNGLKYIKVDRVDNIMNTSRMAHINILRSEGRRLVNRLGATLNTSRRADVFGTTSGNVSNSLTIV